MKIRPARKSDYNQLIPLLNDFVKDNRYSKRNNDSFAKVLKDPRNFIFVAEDKKTASRLRYILPKGCSEIP